MTDAKVELASEAFYEAARNVGARENGVKDGRAWAACDEGEREQLRECIRAALETSPHSRTEAITDELAREIEQKVARLRWLAANKSNGPGVDILIGEVTATAELLERLAMQAARPIDQQEAEHPLTLSEIAEEQFEEAIIASFRLGAQGCREMMARFVDQGGYGDQNIVTSIRANWHPGWGDDPGLPAEIPRNALGDTDERDARHSAFARRAVDHAMRLLDDAETPELGPIAPVQDDDAEKGP